MLFKLQNASIVYMPLFCLPQGRTFKSVRDSFVNFMDRRTKKNTGKILLLSSLSSILLYMMIHILWKKKSIVLHKRVVMLLPMTNPLFVGESCHRLCCSFCLLGLEKKDLQTTCAPLVSDRRHHGRYKRNANTIDEFYVFP